MITQALGGLLLLAMSLMAGEPWSVGDSGRAASRDGFHQSICQGLEGQAAAQHPLRMLGESVESLGQRSTLFLTAGQSVAALMS